MRSHTSVRQPQSAEEFRQRYSVLQVKRTNLGDLSVSPDSYSSQPERTIYVNTHWREGDGVHTPLRGIGVLLTSVTDRGTSQYLIDPKPSFTITERRVVAIEDFAIAVNLGLSGIEALKAYLGLPNDETYHVGKIIDDRSHLHPSISGDTTRPIDPELGPGFLPKDRLAFFSGVLQNVPKWLNQQA